MQSKVRDIQLVVEGDAAEQAAKDLVEKSGLQGEIKTIEPAQTEKDLVITLTVILTLVGIVGASVEVLDNTVSLTKNSVELAKEIHSWYKEWSKGEKENKLERVMLIGANGKRVLLENATVEQIEQFLK